MRSAIFTDMLVPEVNDVVRTLKRFTGFLEKKTSIIKFSLPKPWTQVYSLFTFIGLQAFASFYIRNTASLFRTSRKLEKNPKSSNLISFTWQLLLT